MTLMYYLGIFIVLIAVWAGVLYVAFLAVQNRRYRNWLSKQKYATLLLKVPKNNEKTALSAEQMYASLHGLYRNKWDRFLEGSMQDHISLEIVSSNKYIRFYATAPVHLVEFLEGQLYAQYPTLLVERVDDYAVDYKTSGRNFSSCELILEKNEAYPIRTFETFDVDPLAGITAVLSKLGDSSNQIWIQFLMRPTDNAWQERSNRQVAKIRSGSTGGLFLSIWNILGTLISYILTSGASVDQKEGDKKRTLTGQEEEAIKSIETKATKLGYESKIRIVCFADNSQEAKSKLQSIIGTFKQFNVTNLNGFGARRVNVNSRNDLDSYIKRSFWGNGYVLNTTELASLFHLPSITVETPAIVWSTLKVAEPPSNLPTIKNVAREDLTIFARTNFRGLEDNFGIKLNDRSHHVYIVGKTGMGKTSLLQNMVIDDIHKGRGVAVVDPHGDFVDTVMQFIPSYRVNDIVLFDPGDRDNPVAFNLLEEVEDDYKSIVTSGLVGIFKKLFAESWGPRLEHILRYTFLGLLDYPGSTFLSVPRMLTDQSFRAKVIEKIKDPVVKDFWVTEFEGYPDKIRQEAVMPIQNKVGQFLASSTIRNIVGQPRTSMSVREIMDKSKIFLVKVSKGIVGEDNSALLGAMMVTKIQLAAMSRADMSKEERVPFNLYVDEFQNFATESFAAILSEARKYNLNLHVANQYIAQMDDPVREAIFGNVGTLISFRVGANDAEHLSKEFAPTFTPDDITNLERFQIYLRMTIDGISSQPFSATTLPLPKEKTANKDKIVNLSRERYSSKRDFVENKIKEWTDELDKEKSESDKQNRDRKRKPNKFFGSSGEEKPAELTPEQIEKQNALLGKLKSFQEKRTGNIQNIERSSADQVRKNETRVGKNDKKNSLKFQKKDNKISDSQRKLLDRLKQRNVHEDKKNNNSNDKAGMKILKKVNDIKKSQDSVQKIKSKTSDKYKNIGEITIGSDGTIIEVDDMD